MKVVNVLVTMQGGRALVAQKVSNNLMEQDIEESATISTRIKEAINEVETEYDEFQIKMSAHTVASSHGSSTSHKLVLGEFWQEDQVCKVQ